MKIRLLPFLLPTLTMFVLLTVSNLGIAQTPMRGGNVAESLKNTENLLDISKRNQPAFGIYKGIPFVKIERTVGSQPEEQKSGWMDEEKKRLFGTTQITKTNLIQSTAIATPAPKPMPSVAEITYQTPTGATASALNVPHTTDFISIIQVIDNQTLSVEEFIQTINPKGSLFARTIPANENQSFSQNSFELLRAENNGKPFLLDVQINPREIRLSYPNYLSAGVQSFYLKYIIKSGIFVNQKGQGVLDYPVTGYDWPLPINRFHVLVSFPSETRVFQKNIFFGKNEMSVQNSFTEQTDSNGNTLFTMNNPLPAFASVKIYETFDNEFLNHNQFEQFLTRHIGWFIAILTICAVFIYLCLSAFIVKRKKNEKAIMKVMQSYSPNTLCYLKYGKLTERYLTKYNLFLKNKSKCYRLYQTKKWKYGIKQIYNGIMYFKLSGKYWLTVLLMIGGMIYLSYGQKIYLTLPQYGVILGVSGILTFFFFQYRGRTALLNETGQYCRNLLQEKTFYGLNEQSAMNLFLQHYPRFLALGQDDSWLKLTEKSCPAVKELPFLNQSTGGKK